MPYLDEIGWFLTFPATIVLSYHLIKYALKASNLMESEAKQDAQADSQ